MLSGDAEFFEHLFYCLYGLGSDGVWGVGVERGVWDGFEIFVFRGGDCLRVVGFVGIGDNGGGSVWCRNFHDHFLVSPLLASEGDISQLLCYIDFILWEGARGR